MVAPEPGLEPEPEPAPVLALALVLVTWAVLVAPAGSIWCVGCECGECAEEASTGAGCIPVLVLLAAEPGPGVTLGEADIV